MTCIVGTKCRKGVIIGGDSLGVAGYDCAIRKDPKVGRVGEYVFGYSGSYRMGQVLLYDFDPPEPSRKTAPEVFQFMVSEFVPILRETMKDAAIMKNTSGIEEFDNAEFLVGIHSNLFHVGVDFQIGWPAHPFDAAGCGENFAIGAMHMAYKNKKRGEDLLIAGLSTAETFSAGVRAPFIFESNY